VRSAVLLLLLLLPVCSSALCTDQNWKPGWSWTYDGTVGPHRVRFELARTGGNVTGYYFYASQLKDIRLTGTIGDDKQIRLLELGNEGQPEAKVSGEFPDKDPQGKLLGNLTCDIITGTWQRPDGSDTMPVFLRSVASVSGPQGHRYRIAGADDDETINHAAETFRKAIMNGEKAKVASMVRYPITVYIRQKKTKIENRERLTADYDAIFTPGYRKAIENSIPRDMFARYDGVMLGERGEVWFDADGRVTALNNLLTN
jgi:hypothetical protein